MRANESERVISVELTDKSGDIHLFSGILRQDPNYLSHNRIELLGTTNQSLGLYRFERSGVVHWKAHTRADWKVRTDPDYQHVLSGTGRFIQRGATSGANIAEDAVQPFVSISIFEMNDEYRLKGIEGQRAEYWFLQRPSQGWYIHHRFSLRDPPRVRTGFWRKIPTLGLRFRLVSTSIDRDDNRVTTEREVIDIPGVEIRPVQEMTEDDFGAAAEKLWFIFRTLIAFCCRQPVETLAEFKQGNSWNSSLWHAIELQPRKKRGYFEAINHSFRAPIEKYLAQSAKTILKQGCEVELLHGAAFGYSSSYTAASTESRLTSCLEAIERLLEAFERSNGLTRDLIPNRRWKTLGKAIRKAARSAEANTSEHEAIEKLLSQVPRMTLLERIERMVAAQHSNWRSAPQELLNGADRMISMRNSIVHGRVMSDYHAMVHHVLRAQAMFELLWLAFLGCGSFQDSNWARLSVAHFDAGQADK